MLLRYHAVAMALQCKGFGIGMYRNEIKKNTNAHDEEDLVNLFIYIKQEHTKTQ
jgi:hypothetical protein